MPKMQVGSVAFWFKDILGATCGEQAGQMLSLVPTVTDTGHYTQTAILSCKLPATESCSHCQQQLGRLSTAVQQEQPDSQ